MTELEIIATAAFALAVLGVLAAGLGWVEFSASVRTPALAKRKAAQSAGTPPMAAPQDAEPPVTIDRRAAS